MAVKEEATVERAYVAPLLFLPGPPTVSSV